MCTHRDRDCDSYQQRHESNRANRQHHHTSSLSSLSRLSRLSSQRQPCCHSLFKAVTVSSPHTKIVSLPSSSTSCIFEFHNSSLTFCFSGDLSLFPSQRPVDLYTPAKYTSCHVLGCPVWGLIRNVWALDSTEDMKVHLREHGCNLHVAPVFSTLSSCLLPCVLTDLL